MSSSDVAAALGLDCSLPAMGVVPVVPVDWPVLPGMCFEDDHRLRLDDPALEDGLHRALELATRGPVVLVARKDTSKPPTPDNLASVGTLYGTRRWHFLGEGMGHELEGFALETADVELVHLTGVLCARYTTREWMPEVETLGSEIERVADACDLAPPENAVMWLAGHGMRAAIESGGVHALQAAMEAGPTGLLEAIAGKGPLRDGPSEALLSAVDRTAFSAIVRQAALTPLIEARRWGVDIDAQELTLTDASGDCQAVPVRGILGTVDATEASFRWSWDNPGMRFSDAMTEGSRSLQTSDIPELSQGLVLLTSDTLQRLLMVAPAMLGGPYFLAKPPGQGGFVLVLDHTPVLTKMLLHQAATHMMVSAPVRNHAAALVQGARSLGLRVAMEGRAVTMLAVDGPIRFELDNQGRIASMAFAMDTPAEA